MTKEELTNVICPWAIIIASIVNRITGKELKMETFEFNEIYIKTKLTHVDLYQSYFPICYYLLNN